VIAGIPRILLGKLRNMLLSDYPEFFHRYNQFKKSVNPLPESVDSLKAKEKTSKSFGFEWTRFSDMRDEWEENFRGYFAPKEPSFFENKTVLDAGCGMGRQTYYAAKYGAEVVGIDLSKSVDAAYQNTREFPKAHIVQADIYNLPFRQETFDFVYSIGVLHHLPSPEEGFNKLLGFLKREGEVRFYVYRNLENEPKWKRFLLSIVTVVRKLTTRMPHNLLCGLSFSIAAIVYLIFVLPYKMLSKLTMAKQFAETLPLKQYANYSFRVCYNDVLDRFSAPIENRYSQHEVRAWLERAGLEDISVTSYFGWLGHGRKACKDKG
jgi:SAM-dependent methyltransferase